MYHKKKFRYDKNYTRIFKRHIQRTGLFVPDTWFKSTIAVFSTIKTISAFLNKYPTHTVGQLATVLALGIGSVGVAGMVESLAGVALAFIAAFYVGVIVGCALTALWEYHLPRRGFLDIGVSDIKYLFSQIPEFNYSDCRRLLIRSDVSSTMRSAGFRYVA